MVIIPTFSEPDYTTRVTLDGQDWLFRFRWNQRADRWLLNIGSTDEAPYRTGIHITCTSDLLGRWREDLNLPQGVLVALSLTRDSSPPTRYDFGIGLRVRLYYFEPLTILVSSTVETEA